MKKKLKLYLHHSHYETVSYNKRTGFFQTVLKTIFTICYGIGVGVIAIVTSPIYLYKFFASFPAHLQIAIRKLHNNQFRRTIAAFALIVVVTASGIHGLSLIAAGQDVKGRVLGASDAGFGYLQDAKTSLQAQNIDSAQANFNRALEQFKTSQEALNSTSTVLKGLLSVVPQKHDADRLLEAAQKITEAALKGTELINLTADMKLSAVGLSGGDKNRETLLHAQELLNDSVRLADESAELINAVSINSIPEQYQPTFVAAKDTATFFQSNVASIKEVCSLIFDIVLGQKNTLIVFQNNNELRASGGFMGTVGNARISDGSLNSLDIRSVYDWDGQLKQKILPPLPMRTVTDQWFLRDSNWFADFALSADRISSLFEKEGGETPDLIIAMTPDVIIQMLEKTGPITLPQHNITLTKDNFIEETQTATSITYDKQQNQPKQFLADFFPVLMERLGSQENGGLMGFLEVFQQNLYHKQIVLYSRDSDLEKRITDFNWGGRLRDTDRDYLSIVNSNLGATKTDRFMERSTNLHSTVNSDGTITNQLEYTVTNPLPSVEGLLNKSFIRFYVPEGAKLEGSEGFNRDIPIPAIDNGGYDLDDKVQEWEKGVQQDNNSGTYYGTESGKTWFGNWLIVPGGQSKTVTITYTLPFKLGNLDRQSLLIQKQPGSRADKFNYELEFPGRSSIWNSSTSRIENNKLIYHQDLIADNFLGLVLRK